MATDATGADPWTAVGVAMIVGVAVATAVGMTVAVVVGVAVAMFVGVFVGRGTARWVGCGGSVGGTARVVAVGALVGMVVGTGVEEIVAVGIVGAVAKPSRGASAISWRPSRMPETPTRAVYGPGAGGTKTSPTAHEPPGAIVRSGQPATALRARPKASPLSAVT